MAVSRAQTALECGRGAEEGVGRDKIDRVEPGSMLHVHIMIKESEYVEDSMRTGNDNRVV